MSTSISTPASLATFPQPHASTSKLPHVTLSPVEGGDGNQAVAAVQGDGVWTYDVGQCMYLVVQEILIYSYEPCDR
jgi:hypothetical protein